jgi:hypothetical protein
MKIGTFSPNANGFRPRRTRPEHVALNIERVEHLLIEIHAPSGADAVAPTISNGHDATVPQQEHGFGQLREALKRAAGT